MTQSILLEELRNIEKIIKQKTTSKCNENTEMRDTKDGH